MTTAIMAMTSPTSIPILWRVVMRHAKRRTHAEVYYFIMDAGKNSSWKPEGIMREWNPRCLVNISTISIAVVPRTREVYTTCNKV